LYDGKKNDYHKEEESDVKEEPQRLFRVSQESVQGVSNATSRPHPMVNVEQETLVCEIILNNNNKNRLTFLIDFS